MRAAKVNGWVSCDLHMTANTNDTIRRKWKKKRRVTMNTYSHHRRYQDWRKYNSVLFGVWVKVKHDTVLNICWHNFKLKEIIFPSAHLYFFKSISKSIGMSLTFEVLKPLLVLSALNRSPLQDQKNGIKLWNMYPPGDFTLNNLPRFYIKNTDSFFSFT